MIYSDERPGGILIQSKNRLALERVACEGCGERMNIDIKAAAEDVDYRPKCEACGVIHAFVSLNGAVIVGIPAPHDSLER